MKYLFSIIAVFLFTISATAQNARTFKSFKKTPNGLEISVSDGKYIIHFYNESIVETTFLPTGEAFNPESHAVVLTPQNKIGKSAEKNGTITLTSTGITVSIKKSPFNISYAYKNKLLLSEKNGYAKKTETGNDGKTQQLETLNFNLDKDEALYGGGARVLGMNRRGNRLQLYNRASYGYETRADLMNFTMPLVLSSKIYAVHFDNPAIGYLDLDSKKDNTLAYETISGRKTYQVIAGDSWAKLIENYTSLTGRQPLPPRWALGNFASRFGYRDQEMADKTAQHFIDDKIPVDAMIFDLYWFGKTIKGTMGNLEFDRENFPNPEKMMAGLKEKGIKTILITEPFILTTSSKWQEAVDKKVLATDVSGKPFTYDFYFGNTGLVDVFKPEARNWFWSIYKGLANQGADGVWGDLGEPEVFPSAAFTAKGKADEVHNIYGHNWAKMVFEGYQKDFPNQRPFILMRSGYSGSQRYGMIPWSGDVSRSWGGLSGQMEISLEMGMQGMGYMHSDLGGFAGDYNDNELYLRWLQYGVFQPIFRPHAQENVASEAIYKDILTKEKAKKIIELRYRLLPYNYNLAFANHKTGLPLMRPLFFEEPANKNLSAVSQTYLWGNDFLVTPIIKAGATETSVFFPKGNWFDFFTGEKHSGEKNITVKTAEDHIPVFVRGGAFIPMSKVVQNTEVYSQSDLEIQYYYDADVKTSTSELYLDDGKTPDAYEKKQYEMIAFRSSLDADAITINVNDNPGLYSVRDKKYTFFIHGLDKKPASASVNNAKTTVTEMGRNIYAITVDITVGETQIKIEL
ncbi:MAG: glycosyl hydrolase [Flavobacterium sp. BFFFF1]|uniref:glycoside hydrolase family 31 protein n=1 Tax=Flavobacterium sp. BFFFF1 TaxID=2015557 RepID=UPI000BCCE35F|nr:TIM-barrel domain-containing protein [Flavobacterium sp. BFFFF1]OYU82192.1 MAG: glycosyl hydrolase [Flavobacterium sp. BFFFF1]